MCCTCTIGRAQLWWVHGMRLASIPCSHTPWRTAPVRHLAQGSCRKYATAKQAAVADCMCDEIGLGDRPLNCCHHVWQIANK